ncbi:hypothetical protein [Campylobacter sp. CCS1377]|uniref:Periplasmic protein n=1 Tax=Campylobacter sp. CCS1377 TaxID=3158229 RepID=A0AAU7E6Q3_9BACT
MKKFFLIVLGIVVFLLFVAYVMLFTSFGNKIVSGLIEDKIKQSTSLDVNLTHFDLRFSTLNIEADVANIATIKLDGNTSLFTLGFDVLYDISLNENYAKNLGLNLKQNLNFGGKIQGKASDFIIDGKGYLLGSDVLLDARILDYNPIKLQLKADALKIEEALDLLALPRYALGNLKINADINAKDLKPDGNALINLYTTSINYELLERDFNLSLPYSNIKSTIVALIKNDQIYAQSDTATSYLKLESKKTNYDLSKAALNSDFILNIPDLSKLQRLTQNKLSGNVKVDGNVSLIKNILNELNAKVVGLGGDINAKLKDENLQVNLKDVNIENLTALAGYGNLAKGLLDANLNAKGLDFKNFDLIVKTKQGFLNGSGLKKLTKLDFPSANFSLDVKANAKNAKIDYNGILHSDLVNITQLMGFYNLENKELNLQTKADVKDLSKFKALAGVDVKGTVNLNTNANLLGNEIKKLQVNANIAGGELVANSNGKTLDLKISKLDLTKAFILAAQPNYSSGILDAKVKLNSMDFKNLSGVYELKTNGVLNDAVLSKLLEKKFPKNTKFNLSAKGDIKNSLVDFDVNLKSDLINLDRFKGNFNINTSKLTSDYVLDAYDFSKLGFLLDRKLEGKALFKGNLNYDKNLDATIQSDALFGGNLDANLKNNVLKAKLNQMDLQSLAKGVDFTDLYMGKINANVDYNLLSKQGDANLDLSGGKLKRSAITNALFLLIRKDITNEVYHTAKMDAKINKDLVDFNLNLQAQNSDIKIINANINTKTSVLNVPFDATLDRVEFKGVISGTTQKPNIKLDAKSVLGTVKNILGVKENNKNEDKGQNKLDNLLKKIF